MAGMGSDDEAGGETSGGHRLAAGPADAVAALIQPAQRRVDLGEVVAALAEQGGDVLPFEGDRRTLGIVLVIGTPQVR